MSTIKWLTTQIRLIFVIAFILQSSMTLFSQFGCNKFILDNEGNLYYSKIINSGVSSMDKVLAKMDNGDTLDVFFLVAQDSSIIYDEYAKLGIYEDFIFSITFYNSAHLRRLNSNIPLQLRDSMMRNSYVFDCTNKNTDYRTILKPSWSYDCNFENSSEIAKYSNSIFNYDFIIDENNINVIVLLNNTIYVYQADDVKNLPNVKWNLIGVNKTTIKNEYFVITQNNNSAYTIRTKTQGEYLLSNLEDIPITTKISNELLNNKYFLKDNRTNITHTLSLDEVNLLVKANDHNAMLSSILQRRNK